MRALTRLVVAAIILVGCKTPAPTTDVSGLSVDRDAKNVAVFLGMPAGDAWISNNLPPVKGAVEDPDAGFGFTTFIKDNTTRSQAIEWITNAAAGVGENGTLFIMLAGHGSPDGLIQTHDKQFMNFREVSAAIGAGRKGKARLKRLVLVIFSCYSGNWVNGAPAVADSERYETDKVDLAMRDLADKTADVAAQQLAAAKSRDVGLYEQVLVMTSATRSQYSWGTEFANHFAAGFKALKAKKDTARIKDLIDYFVTRTTSSQPQYRGFPEDVVYNDYLFHDSPDENLYAALEGDAMTISALSDADKVSVCKGTLAACRTEAGDDAEPSGMSGDRRQFVATVSGEADEMLTVLARNAAGRLISARSFRLGTSAAISDETEGAPANRGVYVDQDADGVDDALDYCMPTPSGKAVTKTGKWSGCSSEQAAARENLIADATDTDGDGISDRYDRCAATPAGVTVYGAQMPQWYGCSTAQYMCKAYRQQCPPANPTGDDDADGVVNGEDKCAGTPAGKTVWKSDDPDKIKWKGCAQGQSPG
jgi:hypothetical protein